MRWEYAVTTVPSRVSKRQINADLKANGFTRHKRIVSEADTDKLVLATYTKTQKMLLDAGPYCHLYRVLMVLTVSPDRMLDSLSDHHLNQLLVSAMLFNSRPLSSAGYDLGCKRPDLRSCSGRSRLSGRLPTTSTLSESLSSFTFTLTESLNRGSAAAFLTAWAIEEFWQA